MGRDELDVAAVLHLYAGNKRTLGFLPDEAFRERIARGTLWIAATPSHAVAGYVLFDRTRRGIVVRHLCVDTTARGQGLARQLLDAIVDRWPDAPGISLLCRRDWPAAGMWPQLGFVAYGERAGRGRDGAPLTYWWRALAARGLFDWTAGPGSPLPVVADLNVVLDLYDPTRHGAEQSQVLVSPACEGVELLIADQLRNEINDLASDHREKQRAFVEQFRHVPVDVNEADRLHRKLLRDAAEHGLRGFNADLRYVAEAASAGLSTVVTRDADARTSIASIAKGVDVEVLSPAELVLRSEELRDANAFRPARLLDSPIEVRAPVAGDESDLIDAFLNRSDGERKPEFRATLRRLLSQPTTYSASLVRDVGEARLLSIFITEIDGPMLDVPMFRMTPSRLALSLARQLAFRLRETARAAGLLGVRVSDPHPSHLVSVALEEEGFVAAQGCMHCPVVDSIGTSTEVLPDILSALAHVPVSAPARRDPTKRWMATMSNMTAAELESRLWPLKVTDAPLASFIVPIKPVWAAALFDVGLSSATLFPRPRELAIAREHAYFRSPKPATVFAPARIAWYVSGAGRVAGAGAVRACSQLVDVDVGPVGEVYARHKHLGIYSYADVESAAKDNVVMAFRFAQTERFPSPVSLPRLRELAKSRNLNVFLQGPMRIEGDFFAEIYRSGFEGE